MTTGPHINIKGRRESAWDRARFDLLVTDDEHVEAFTNLSWVEAWTKLRGWGMQTDNVHLVLTKALEIGTPGL